MCYVLLLSTSSHKDLAQFNNELVTFSRQLPKMAESKALKYRNQWYVGSKSGCSCAFRHLHSVELGFGPPVDWYPEDADEISATIQVIEIIRDLVAIPERVDCVDAWEHQEMRSACSKEVQVDLASVTNEAFRFFENHHFVFTDSLLEDELKRR